MKTTNVKPMRLVILVEKDASSNRIIRGTGKTSFQLSIDTVTDIIQSLNNQDKVS